MTATRESNEIAREALVSQDRAWLDVSVVEIGSLEMDGDEIRITLNFSVKNIGRSPALHINMSTQLVSMIDAFSSNLQKDMIEKLDNYPIDRVRIPGGTLFPERHFTQKRNFSTTGGFVQKNRDAFEGEGDPPVMLNVIGCVQYFLPGSVKPRHTSFAYEINYKGSAQGAIFSESNLPLPPDKIALSVPVARQLIID